MFQAEDGERYMNPKDDVCIKSLINISDFFHKRIKKKVQ